MRTIKLNQVYITTFGKEFTPIEKLPPEPHKETKFKDIHGNTIKKSKLWFIKGEDPPKKPTSTI